MGFNPLLISANDKLQMVSGNGSTSIYSSGTSSGVYIGSSGTYNAANANQDQLVVGNGSGR